MMSSQPLAFVGFISRQEQQYTSSENTMVLCHNALKIFLFVCSVKTWLDFVSNVIVLQSSEH